MDPTQIEADDLETLEKGYNPLSRVGEIGSAPEAGRAGSDRQKPLAHVQVACDKRTPEQRLFAKLRAEELDVSVSRTALDLMNRRMRTRMSGGVRGDG